MNVIYFHRNENAGFSIGKVFRSVIKEIKKKEYIQEFYVPYFSISPIKIIKNIYFVYKNRSTSINHISGDINYCVIGLRKKNSVLTIHDLDCGKKRIYRNLIHLFWNYIPAKRVGIITCVSNYTRSELIKSIPSIKNKVFVIHNPVDEKFKYIKKEFDKQKPIILHIGTTENKNLLRVIESLKDICCHLRIIGYLSPLQLDYLRNFKIDYSNAVNLSDLEIVNEYGGCDIVSFPSTYEGFGMPIIEGQATGRVVLTSAIEPMIEVSRDSVCYVNPYDVSSISAAFKKITIEDDYRENLINLGFENIKRFSVEEISNQYISIYNKLYQMY